jgi:hypothetical protein
MISKRPVLLTIASICLVILVIFSAGLTLARNFGLLSPTFGATGLTNRRFNMGSGQGNLPQGSLNGQQPGDLPGLGTGQLPGNMDPNSTGGQPDFQNFQGRTGGGNSLFRILNLVTTGFNIAAIVLGLLAAVGLWRQKKWAAVLAIILSCLILLTSFTGLLRIFSWLTFGEALLKVLLSLAVIILLLLPASRKAYSPPPDLDLDLDL